jgi:hypothetical protein
VFWAGVSVYGNIVTVRRRRQFIDFRRTEQAAKKAAMPIAEYLEDQWNCQGQADRVSSWMQESGFYAGCRTIVEIGPGSGRFLVPTLERAKPLRYEIYETASLWAQWLVRANQPYVISRPADGWSLGATPSDSCELAHAHGVFVYLNPLTCFEYFMEMMRVTMPGGHVVFDFFPCDSFDERSVLAWLAVKDRFATLLPRPVVTQFFQRRGYDLVSTFHRRVAAGRATYLAFRNVGDLRT